MKDKLILKDGTTMELEAAASLTSLTTIFVDWNATAQTMQKLTKENLVGAKVQSDEGRVWIEFTDVAMQPGSWEIKEDGVHITVSLREKTEIEKRLDNMEAGQETQDGAIAEIAGMVGGEK